MNEIKMKKISLIKSSILLCAITFLQNTAFAQENSGPNSLFGNNKLTWIYILLYAIIVFAVFLTVLVAAIAFQLVKYVRYKKILANEGGEAYIKAYEEMPWWQKIMGFEPQVSERYALLDHNYDGITELDNPIPGWFMSLFYGTVFFGAVYLLNYHVIGKGNVQEAEYEVAIKEGEASREAYIKKFAASINENNVKVLTDSKAISEGKKVYDANCLACHGAKGEGKVGPNLTDEYWLHGNTIKNIFHVVSEGVPQKGMISWKKQLNPLQIQQVSSFIIGIKGSNPPNPKAPQGEKM